MKHFFSGLLLSVSVLLLGISTVCSAQGKALPGGVDGGGGFQYPNSQRLLRFVATGLANDIEGMDDQAFALFPTHLKRLELASILRHVVELPEGKGTRVNDQGLPEGLMFDYDRHYCNAKNVCGPRIMALQSFFDAYKSLPVAQILRDKPDEEYFVLTLKDLRQRLLHEAAHLLEIGVKVGEDFKADKFAENIEKAILSQYFRCDSPGYRSTLEGKGMIYTVFVLNLHSHRLGSEEVGYNRGDMIGDEPAENNAENMKQQLLAAADYAVTHPPLRNGDFSGGVNLNWAVRTLEPETYRYLNSSLIFMQWSTNSYLGESARTIWIDLKNKTLRIRRLLMDPYLRKPKAVPADEIYSQCQIYSPTVPVTGY